ncbi:regulatory protein RecX [Arthrobacter agilis]|uniref:regulatory protein RecX n=1 Tax=Arthrobacter agilis TaxID=37921 RepID=UPI002366633E|nr:regulatory protein RecX [Arthrobacter agilis]WDF34417.1 regulatory protein RecX [Arthrobacter agilis]
MPGDAGADSVGWGTSFDRFGTDSSAASPDTVDEQAKPTRTGLQRSRSGFGSTSSFGKPSPRRTGAGAAGRGSARGRTSEAGRTQRRERSGPGVRTFEDPFGPVVGSSADDADQGHSAAADDALTSGRSGGRGGTGRRSSTTRRTGAGARAGRSGADAQAGSSGSSEPPAAKSDEDWTSLARAVALRQLALGARSRHQLQGKLTEREVPPGIASALLDRFEEVQLIDDAEFARMWVRTRVAAKALSRSSLRRELAEKGIAADLAEDALGQLTDEEELEQARTVIRRKLRGSVDLTDHGVRDKEIRRLVGVLARKGYNPGSAFAIVKDVISEARTSAEAE